MNPTTNSSVSSVQADTVSSPNKGAGPIRGPVENDPKVSCCLVAGEYMRGSGFFYRTAGRTYLVTARHNVLPTNSRIPNQATGGVLWEVTTDDYLPTVDIYLRESDSMTRKRVDIRELDDSKLISDPTVDILLVQISFTPEEWGYTVFTDDDATTCSEENDQLTAFGFPDASQPQTESEYSVPAYKQALRPPCELSVPNEMKESHVTGTAESVLGVTLIPSEVSPDALDGFSGAPWLGDGWLGVHSGVSDIPAHPLGGPADETWQRVHFFSSVILEKVVK